MSQFSKEYQNFFQKSEAGQYFMKWLTENLANQHKSAENDPDHSNAFTQRAKGLRMVEEHINIVSIERGKKE